MTVLLRRATEADAEDAAALLGELGYPTTATDALDRLSGSLRSRTSYCLVAESAGAVVGLINAELVPYFPTGATLCRVTALVVSSPHRGQGLGRKLLAKVAEFARQHDCSGIELTSAERRVEAHRFYQKLGFSRTAFRFFQAL
jgi:ribosomal protein S18 acetylase RimI-like enzyme